MPQDERAPAFQFYPKDFLSDPNVMMMDLAQRGAYITLLCVCWQQDGLSKDESVLAKIVGRDDPWWAEFGGPIRGCFRVYGRKLVHPRLQSEKKKQKKRRLSAQKGAETVNRKRYGKQEDSSHSDRIATQEARTPTPTPSSSPTPVCEERTHTGLASKFCPDDFVPNPIMVRQAQITPGVDLGFELTQFKLHEFASPRTDWDRAWVSWLNRSRPPQAKPEDARRQTTGTAESKHPALVAERQERERKRKENLQ